MSRRMLCSVVDYSYWLDPPKKYKCEECGQTWTEEENKNRKCPNEVIIYPPIPFGFARIKGPEGACVKHAPNKQTKTK